MERCFGSNPLPSLPRCPASMLSRLVIALVPCVLTQLGRRDCWLSRVELAQPRPPETCRPYGALKDRGH